MAPMAPPTGLPAIRNVHATAGVVIVNALVVAAATRGWGPLSLLAALAVPLLVGLTRRPQRGVLVLAALVPFDGLLLLTPDLPGLAAGWKELLVLATLAASFAASPDARASRGRRPPAWAPAVAGMLILALASAVLVGGRQALWGLKIAFFFVLVAAIVWRCPLDRRERDRLVSVLMVAGVITALYGIVQQAMGHARLHELGYEYNSAIRFTRGLLRSFSTFDNPFGFGYFLMLVLLVGVTVALAQPRRLRSRLFFLVLPLLLVGLGTSFVRGAWIGLAAGLTYVGFARFRAILLGLPVVIVALILLPGPISSAAFASTSGVQRVDSWQANLSDVIAHPLGVGVGSSNAAAEKVLGPDRIEEVFHPDNEYYRAVYELGVLGLWFILLLLTAAFRAARIASKTAPPEASVFALATAAMVVAAAFASLVTTYFDTFPSDVYFWLLLGAVASEHASRLQQEATELAPVSLEEAPRSTA